MENRGRRLIFTAIVIIALGVVFSTALKSTGSLGIVFIAIGGLLFILGMARRKEEQDGN